MVITSFPVGAELVAESPLGALVSIGAGSVVRADDPPGGTGAGATVERGYALVLTTQGWT